MDVARSFASATAAGFFFFFPAPFLTTESIP